MRSLFAILVLLIASSNLSAQARSIPDAVKKGGEFLQGQWKAGGGANLHQTGGAALAGMAMLEAGIPKDDVAVQNVLKYIRDQALSDTQTYHVSLAILFLDKYADPRDVPTIQMLGLRLYAGLTNTGGWTYSTWDPVPNEEVMRLQRALQQNELVAAPNQKPAAPQDPFRNPGAVKPDAPVVAGKLHAEVARTSLLVQQALRARGRNGVGGGDNSNTQFGLIGLYVASRHGLMVNDAFTLVEAHFLKTQNPRDGGWGYTGLVGDSTVAMTCAGLIGLAIGQGTRDRVLEANVKKPIVPEKESDPFFNPQTSDGAPAKSVAPNAVKPAGTISERATQAGLRAIGLVIAATAKAGPGQNALANFTGIGNMYYMLWSVERMAMALGLDTIATIDWHQWGANYLLPMQQADGSFGGDGYGADINTSFALLFLTKANSVRDLGTKVKDLGKTELRSGTGAGNSAPLFAPTPKDVEKPTTTPSQTSTDSPKKNTPNSGGFTLPPTVAALPDSDIEQLTKGLTSAKDEEWLEKLKETRESKGEKYTRSLMLAAGRLEGIRRIEARDALAERLARMTSGTLRIMLKDTDAELRRAACLACGMRDELQFIPDLMERIPDASDLVTRAARASLKSLTGTDFGPPSNAEDEAKAQAAAAWRKWYEANRKQ